MAEWSVRPLDPVNPVYPVIFIDAILLPQAGASPVKVRDGQVTNRPIYVAIGVTVNGERAILGLWAGDGGEGSSGSPSSSIGQSPMCALWCVTD
jgi:putative transposase